MSFSAVQLKALGLLVEARLAGVAAESPERPKWEGLLAAVRRERPANDTTATPAGEGTGAAPPKLGELVFAIDLPLQVEKPRAKPRLLFAKPGGDPQPIKGKLATKLFGDAKKARAAMKSWAALPAGVAVPFGGGQITSDWTPIVLVLAPTMNALRGMPTFSKQNARKVIATHIADARKQWPKAAWGGRREAVKHGNTTRVSPVGGERRFVRVTRFSSRRPDDLSPDVIGAKLALDQLVAAGILGDDSDAWCAREGRWEAAPTGQGRLRIEVFTLTGEDAVPRAKGRKKAGGR